MDNNGQPQPPEQQPPQQPPQEPLNNPTPSVPLTPPTPLPPIVVGGPVTAPPEILNKEPQGPVATSVYNSENEPKGKLLKWGIRVVLLAIFLVLTMLLPLHGNTAYLKKYVGNTGSAGTPASCTKYQDSTVGVKGFPLAYTYTAKSSYTYDCISQGDGTGQGSTSVKVSPSYFKFAYVGVAVDAATALILTFLASFIIRKLAHGKF
jgi:hypothetical protein